MTYEDILALPPERIAAADYRALEGVNCIYVETEPDDAGYVERYWVSVSSGLLAAAERECDGAVVYRMAALTVSYDGVDAEDFTLPNGTVRGQGDKRKRLTGGQSFFHRMSSNPRAMSSSSSAFSSKRKKSRSSSIRSAPSRSCKWSFSNNLSRN